MFQHPTPVALNKIITALLMSTLFLGCSKQEPQKSSQRFFRISTVIDVIIYDTAVYDNTLWEAVDSVLVSWENRFSPDIATSEIAKINNRTSDTLVISSDLAHMIKMSQNLSYSIDTLFDLTLQPLKTFWQPENRKDTTLPSPQDSISLIELNKLMTSLGMEQISLNDDTLIFHHPKTTIDVGGVAKGYVLKALEQLLIDKGAKNFLINAGGDVLIKGEKQPNTPFTIGIQHPRLEEDYLAIFATTNKSVVTSGDYERYRIGQDGARIHHIFDPRTGLPVEENQSVSIIAQSPIVADILSTGLFSFPAKRIIEKVEKMEDVDALVVTKSGKQFRSSHFPQ